MVWHYIAGKASGRELGLFSTSTGKPDCGLGNHSTQLAVEYDSSAGWRRQYYSRIAIGAMGATAGEVKI